LNLGSHLPELKPVTGVSAAASHLNFDTLTRERSFKPWLLTAALLLLLADLIVSFALRRLLPQTILNRVGGLSKASTTAALALGIALSHAPQAKAADADIDPAVRAAIMETRLAYIATGAADIDRIADLGLKAVTRVLYTRTAAELGEPARVDLASPTLTSDKLMPYPLIYWRITTNQNVPSARALSAVNDYLHRGGMVVFDAPTQPGALGSAGVATGIKDKLGEILQGLDIPQVAEIEDEHVLNRAFYLMHGLPGRYNNGVTLAQRDPTANDGVSSVVIGSNDWAAAWARDAEGVGLYAVIPGGEKQREMAYRSGVNLVMYALTGNYKSDQVHVPAILQRLTQ
jgi:hypothetical protein